MRLLLFLRETKVPKNNQKPTFDSRLAFVSESAYIKDRQDFYSDAATFCCMSQINFEKDDFESKWQNETMSNKMMLQYTFIDSCMISIKSQF